MISSHILSRYSFLASSVTLFNPFFSLGFFCPSLLKFFHFLRSSIILITSCVNPLDSPNLNHSQILRHIVWYCSTANPQSHFHIRLQQVFLLSYLALYVAEPVTSPNPGLVFAFSPLWFSSILSRSLQPIIFSLSQYLLQAVSVHSSYGIWTVSS